MRREAAIAMLKKAKGRKEAPSGVSSEGGRSSYDERRQKAVELLKRKQAEVLSRNYEDDYRSLADRVSGASSWQDADTMAALVKDVDAFRKRTDKISRYRKEQGETELTELLGELDRIQGALGVGAMHYSGFQNAEEWQTYANAFDADAEKYGSLSAEEIKAHMAQEDVPYEQKHKQLTDKLKSIKVYTTVNTLMGNTQASIEGIRSQLEEILGYKVTDADYQRAVTAAKEKLSGEIAALENSKRQDAEAANYYYYQKLFDGPELSGVEMSDEQRSALVRQMTKARQTDINAKSGLTGYSYLTDDEKARFDYLYRNEGPEAAEAYYDYLYGAERYDESLARRIAGERAKDYGNDFTRILGSVPLALGSWSEGLSRAFQSGAQPTVVSEYQNAIMRSELGSGAAKFFYDLTYNTANQLPNIAAGLATGSILGGALSAATSAGKITGSTAKVILGSAKAGESAVLFGLPIYGNAKNEAMLEGYSESQAQSYALMSAASEVVLGELLGGMPGAGKWLSGEVIESFSKTVSSALGAMALSSAGHFVSEATEEGLQEILDVAFRNVIFGEHEGVAPGDVLYATILGGVSALAMGPLDLLDSSSQTAKLATLGKEFKNLYVGGKITSEDVRATAERVLAGYADGSEEYAAAKHVLSRLDKNKRATKLDLVRLSRAESSLEAKEFFAERGRIRQSRAEDGSPILWLRGEAEQDFVKSPTAEALMRELDGKKSVELSTAFENGREEAENRREVTLHIGAGGKKYDASVVLLRGEKGGIGIESVSSIAESDFREEMTEAEREDAESDARLTEDIIKEQYLEREKKGSASGGYERMLAVYRSENEGKENRRDPLMYAAEYLHARLLASQGYDPVSIRSYAMEHGFGLSEAQLSAAVADGLEERKRKDEAVEQRIAAGKEKAEAEGRKAKKGSISYAGGRVKVNGKEIILPSVTKERRDSLTAEQREAVVLAEKVLAPLGAKIVFYESMMQRETAGFYHAGVIYVNLASSGTKKGLDRNFATETLAHELVHLCEEYSPDFWRTYSDMVLGYLTMGGVKLHDLVEQTRRDYEKSGVTLEGDEAVLREIVAEASIKIFAEKSDLLGMIKEKNPGFFGNFKKLVKRAIENVRKRFLSQPDSELARILRPHFDELATVFDTMMADALDTRKAVGEMGSDEVKFAIKNIQGVSGKNYGIGVYLDSTLLGGLTESERYEIIKLYIHDELAGKSFIAYDGNTPIEISIAERGEKIKRKKKVEVLSELYRKNINKEIKQESVVLSDELIEASSYGYSKAATKPHDWLDNYGKNDWEYRTVYIQQKNKAVWTARLNIANTTDGRKLLYDIDKINEVEGPVFSGPTTTSEDITVTSDDNISIHSIPQNPDLSTDISKKNEKKDEVGGDAQARVPANGGKKSQSDAQKLSRDKRDMERFEAETKRIEKLKESLSAQGKLALLDKPYAITMLASVKKGNITPEAAALALVNTEGSFLHTNSAMLEAMAKGYDKAGIGLHTGKNETELVINRVERELDREDAEKGVREFSDRDSKLIEDAMDHYVGDSKSYAILADYKEACEAHEKAMRERDKLNSRAGSLRGKKRLDAHESAELKNIVVKREALNDKIRIERENISRLEDTPLLRGILGLRKRRAARRTEYDRLRDEVKRAKAKADERVRRANERAGERIERAIDVIEGQAAERVERAKAAQASFEEKHRALEDEYRKKYLEALEKDREKREARETRAKLLGRAASVANQWYTMLSAPTKEKNIPEELRASVARVFEIVKVYKNFGKIAWIRSELDSLEKKIQNTEGGTRELEIKKSRLEEDLRALEGTEKSRIWEMRFGELANIVKNMENAGQMANATAPYIEFAPELSDRIGELVRELGDLAMERPNGVLSIYDLGNRELEIVVKIMESMHHSIKEVRLLHDEKRNKNAFEVSGSIMKDCFAVYDGRKDKGVGAAIRRLDRGVLAKMKFDSYAEMVPTYFAEFTGKYGEEIIGRLMEGMFGEKGFADRKLWVDEELEKIKKTYHTDKWSGKREKTVTVGDITLTTSQIMSLYIHSKLKQSRRHMIKADGGLGIAPDPGELKAVLGGKKYEQVAESKWIASEISNADVNAFINGKDENGVPHLTDEQKACADAMHKIFETFAEWGNEVTMTLYLYKAYTVENYFPIEAIAMPSENGDDKKSSNQQFRAPLPSFTKHRDKMVRRPLKIRSIFNIFEDYASKMLHYSCFEVVESDIRKILNYREAKEGKVYSLTKAVEAAYGARANDYVADLMATIDGTKKVKDAGAPKFIDMILTKMKAAAVLGNVSVIAQQPSAIARARAYLSIEELMHGVNTKGRTEDMLKHSTRARWKMSSGFDMANFDPMGNTGMRGVGDKLTEKLGKPAGAADALTWSAIWAACRYKVIGDDHKIKPNTDEFYDKVNALFNTIIDHTQVMDSVMHRSMIMRSSNFVAKHLTAFMAEPTLFINMLCGEAVRFARSGKTRADCMRFLRVCYSLLWSQILNTLLASLIYAMRDDEEEKSYYEKYMDKFLGRLVGWEPYGDGWSVASFLGSEANLFFGKLPGFNSAFGILEGFSPSGTPDMELFSEFVDTFRALGELGKSAIEGDAEIADVYDSCYQAARAFSNFSGIPVSNIMRDIEGFFQTFFH